MKTFWHTIGTKTDGQTRPGDHLSSTT